jgi:hypothetical protein
MSAIITTAFRVNNAKQFKDKFGQTPIYLFIGKSTSWSDDNSPPTPTDNVRLTTYELWRTILGLKKVTQTDVSLCIPRNNWANNTFYSEYSPFNSDLITSNTFYVITDDFNVYKCLYNNRGANSTIKPTGTSTTTIATSDDYQWKYMYTVTAAESLKFVTDNYIPVKQLTADDGSAQWDVQIASVNGSITITDVANVGTGYLTNNGTFQQITSGSVLRIANSASTTDDVYVGSSLYVLSGNGAGQIRKIIDYVGSSRTVTVNTSFTSSPNTSSTYHLSPTVNFYGDGSGASGYANVSSGGVIKVNMINNGVGYSNVITTITANSSHGQGARIQGYLAPANGHGFSPVDELGGYNVMLNVKLTGQESNNWSYLVNNDFRVIGLVINPLLANNNQANNSLYDQTIRLNIANSDGEFTYDEKIVGQTSGAFGHIVHFANTNAARTAGVLRITSLSTNNQFSIGEVIVGQTSSIEANVVSITKGDLKPYSGKIIYIDQRTPITRATDQSEDIKLIVRF